MEIQWEIFSYFPLILYIFMETEIKGNQLKNIFTKNINFWYSVSMVKFL